jgi:iron complex outermembrane recepter protein
MNKWFPVFLAVTLLFVFSGWSAAESNPDTFMMEEIIVRGERLYDVEESLEIRDIRKTPARDLGEALNKVDGVTFIRKGVIANDIELRGFNRDDLNVLIDGARIYGACPNRMDPASFHVDFAEIEQVTVLKGPFDVKNAGSLGGVVNAKTMSPEKGSHANLVTLFGSYKDINTAVNASHATDSLDVLFGYSYKYSLPYKDGNGDRITEVYPMASPNRYLEDEQDEKAYSMNTYWTKLGLKPGRGRRMEIGYTRQEADDVIYPYLLMDAVYDNTNRLNGSYEIKNPSRYIEKATLQVYWNNIRHDMTDGRRASSLNQPAGYSMRTFAKTETYGGKFSFESGVGEGRVSYGTDYYMRKWDAKTTFPTGTQDSIPDVSSSDIGIYAEYKDSLTEKLVLTIGGRFDHADIEAGKDRGVVYQPYYGTVDTEENDNFFSGNFQLLYTFYEGLEVFTGAGLSVRPPDPAERYFALVRPMTKPNWVGNPDLDPAENREIDMGIKYRRGRFQGKASLYYSDVKDYITVVNVTGTGGAKPSRSYRNVDAMLYGGECTLQLALPCSFFLKGGLAYTWGEDDTLDIPLAEIPPLEANVAVRYDPEQWFAELEGVFSDKQDRVETFLQEVETSGWGAANFNAGMEFKQITLGGFVQNIFDKRYYRHLSYQRDPFSSGIKIPEIGRSIGVTLSLKI